MTKRGRPPKIKQDSVEVVNKTKRKYTKKAPTEIVKSPVKSIIIKRKSGTEEVKLAPDSKPAKKKYLTNKEFLEELKNCKKTDKVSPLLGEMFMKISNRFATKPQYANYSYNDDMRSFALTTIMKVWRGFDPKKSQNPFAYFTQIIKTSFFQYLNNEKKQRLIRDQLLIVHGNKPSYNYGNSDEGDYYNEDHSENHHVVDSGSYSEE